MTTFQDQPPQSRRSVRHSERADNESAVRPDVAPTGRRAQLPSATEWTDDVATPTPATPADAPTVRPRVPSYNGPSFAPANTATPHTSHAAAAPVDAPTQREADARPAGQGRRVSLPAGDPTTSSLPVVVVPQSAASAPAPEVVSSQTALAPVAPTAAATVPPIEAPPADAGQPLTRRELRERRAAAERAAEQRVPEAIDSLVNSGPILLPYLSQSTASPVTEAPVPTPVVAVQPHSDPPVTSAPAVSPRSAATDAAIAAPTRSVEDALAEFDALTREPAEGADAPADGESSAGPISAWGPPVSVPVEPVVAEVEPVIAEAPAVTANLPKVEVPAAVVEEVPFAASVEPVFLEPEAAPVSAREAGHWSVAQDDNDDFESLENTITRTVGGGGTVLTTSALVLPSLPETSDITTPYSATGEIMITGSIDLPRSLGATGAHPYLVDNSDFEFDPLDREVASLDSQPVRAIRAVSTHTSSNGMIVGKKPQGNRMLTVLLVAAAGLALGVAALLAIAISNGVLG